MLELSDTVTELILRRHRNTDARLLEHFSEIILQRRHGPDARYVITLTRVRSALPELVLECSTLTDLIESVA